MIRIAKLLRKSQTWSDLTSESPACCFQNLRAGSSKEGGSVTAIRVGEARASAIRGKEAGKACALRGWRRIRLGGIPGSLLPSLFFPMF
jgi:hypothetical protein